MPDTYEITDTVTGSTYRVDMDHEPTDDDVRSILTEARKTWSVSSSQAPWGSAPALRGSTPPRLESRPPTWISDFREDPEAPSVPIPGAGRQLAALSKPSALAQAFGIDTEAPPAARAMAKETGTILTRPLQKALGGARDVAGLALSTVTPGAGGRLAQNADKATDLLAGFVPLKDELAATLGGGIGAGLDTYKKNFAEDPIGQVLNTAGAVGLLRSPAGREVNSTSRALMASGDLSAAGRQGLVLAATRPKQAATAFGEGVVAALSPAEAMAQRAALAKRPNAKRWEETGLAVGKEPSEYFSSSYAEDLPGVGALVVKPSQRAFDATLERLRADVWDATAADLEKRGITYEQNPEVYHDLSRWVNVASGEGSLGNLAPLSPVLGEAMFAPKWQASRLQLLNPMTYTRLSPEVRRLAARDMAGALSLSLSTLALAKAMGAEVATDPESVDWGKVKLGDQRFDLFGAGVRPWMRVAALAVRDGLGSEATQKAALRRGEGLLSPMAGLVLEAARGTQYNGQPFDPESGVLDRFTPLFLQDLRDAWQVAGPRGAALAVPAGFGAGVQSYRSGSEESTR